MLFPPDVNGRCSGIYLITCLVNGKVYVGSAKKLRARFNVHINDLRNNIHHGVVLQRAWNKYGVDNFSYELLEYVLDKADLVKREQF